jgi:hypothetical protein
MLSDHPKCKQRKWCLGLKARYSLLSVEATTCMPLLKYISTTFYSTILSLA